MKILALAVAAAALAVAAALAAGSASGASTSYSTFKTPSGKILCAVYIAKKPSQSELRCDILTGLRPKVKRPKGCEFDFGSTLILRRTGRTKIGCVSDAIGTAKKVVGYGKTYRKGPFKCRSARKGLTCTNRSRHGFFLSKQRWKKV